MDHTVHGILQARILEWIAFPFSRGSSQPRDQTQVSRIAGEFFTSWATRETTKCSTNSLHITSQLDAAENFQFCFVPQGLHLSTYINIWAHDSKIVSAMVSFIQKAVWLNGKTSASGTGRLVSSPALSILAVRLMSAYLTSHGYCWESSELFHQAPFCKLAASSAEDWASEGWQCLRPEEAEPAELDLGEMPISF